MQQGLLSRDSFTKGMSKNYHGYLNKRVFFIDFDIVVKNEHNLNKLDQNMEGGT